MIRKVGVALIVAAALLAPAGVGNSPVSAVGGCANGICETWTRPFSGGSIVGVGTDALGNVYVGGAHSNWDYGTIKYDPEGVEEWARYYDSGSQQVADVPTAFAVDSTGSSYVTGLTGAGGVATVKYDSAGIEQWVAVDASGSFTFYCAYYYPPNLAFDSYGAAYVGFCDWVWKYASDGELQWKKRFDTT